MTIRRKRRDRGQTLVEFALVFPIFLLVLFAILDIGRYVFVNNSINQAAREGARYGSVEQWYYTCPASVPVASKDLFTCTAATTKERLVGAAVDNPTVTCSDGAGVPKLATECGTADILKVVVTTGTTTNKFRFFTPVIGQIFSPPTIVGTAQVAIQ